VGRKVLELNEGIDEPFARRGTLVQPSVHGQSVSRQLKQTFLVLAAPTSVETRKNRRLCGFPFRYGLQL
jgi:hypothetical protein